MKTNVEEFDPCESITFDLRADQLREEVVTKRRLSFIDQLSEIVIHLGHRGNDSRPLRFHRGLDEKPSPFAEVLPARIRDSHQTAHDRDG